MSENYFHENYKPQCIKLPEPVGKLYRLEEQGFTGIDELLTITKNKPLRFPFLATQYFLDLIDKKNLEDPLRKVIIPTKEELQDYIEARQGSYDTSGEAKNQKAPGLQHKYGPTGLALISNNCAGLCRECFPKRIFLDREDGTGNTATFPNEEALQYVAGAKEMNTLLLTGGDALMLTDDSLDRILDMLNHADFSHIETIRLGTKMTSFHPSRITDDLALLLRDYKHKSGKEVQVCSHYEHPKELTLDSMAALHKLQDAGIAQYNQTVLLKGINDKAQTLYNLFEELSINGVRPYYLFQCRPVVGSTSMALPLNEGFQLFNEATRDLTGIHKPRYAMSTKRGKMEIAGLHPNNNDIVLLKQHSAKKHENTGRLILYNTKKNNPYWYMPKNKL